MPDVALRHRFVLALTLSLGMGLSILAALFVQRWEASVRRVRFQRQMGNLSTSLQRSLNRYSDLLAFLGDYYRVGQEPVSRQLFAMFVGRSLQTYSGIQALEWAPLVAQADRASYEQQLRHEGYGNFQIMELSHDGRLVPAGQRPYYVPVTYVEPLQGNESALGYDLNSNRTRAQAIAQARDSGEIAATGRVRLVQEQRDQFGFLLFLPVYSSRQVPTSPELHRQQLLGVLLGVFRVSDVVEEALRGLRYEIDFTLYDRTAEPAEQFLGRYDAVQKQVMTQEANPSLVTRKGNAANALLCPSVADCTLTFALGQRRWAIIFSPSPSYTIDTPYGAIATLFIGFVLTGSLVLFLHRLNRELETSKTVSDLKFRFFSLASHELRTPLSTILLSSESLQVNHSHLSEAQKQANIQRIHLTAKRMNQQITDLLTLTRADVHQLEFQPELLNLEQFCQQIVDDMQLGISQPIQIKRQGQASPVFLDKTLLQSLLTNLLSNAAKYSPAKAPIQVSITYTPTGVTLTVQDQGIGIPLAEQARLGDLFYRGSNVGTITGTGLGLAVVKTAVELHGGTWTIASQPDRGTTVTIQLPSE